MATVRDHGFTIVSSSCLLHAVHGVLLFQVHLRHTPCQSINFRDCFGHCQWYCLYGLCDCFYRKTTTKPIALTPCHRARPAQPSPAQPALPCSASPGQPSHTHSIPAACCRGVALFLSTQMAKHRGLWARSSRGRSHVGASGDQIWRHSRIWEEVSEKGWRQESARHMSMEAKIVDSCAFESGCPKKGGGSLRRVAGCAKKRQSLLEMCAECAKCCGSA